MQLIGMQNGSVILENSLAVSKNIKYRVSIRTSNSILQLYSRELKTYIHMKTCKQISIVALFIIAPKYKQPKNIQAKASVWKAQKEIWI